VSLRARDLLSPDILRVPAESHPIDYRKETDANRILAFAVFEDGTFLGLVDAPSALGSPTRIFADVCHPISAPPISDSTPVEEILAEMERQRTNVLPVVEANGCFLGAVSRPRIIDVLLRQTRERLLGIERLVATGMDLGTSLPLEAVLQKIVELAAQLTHARYGALGVLDDKGKIDRFLISGVGQATREAIGRPPESMALLGELLREGRALRLRELSQHPKFSGFPPHHPVMRSFLGMPIRYRDRIIGDLYLADKEGADEFDEEDEALVVAFAAQAAIAIDNVRLYAETRHRAEQLAALHETTRALNAELSLDLILKRLVVHARELVGAKYGALAVLDDEGRTAQFLTAGLSQADQKRIGPLPQGKGLLGAVFRGERAVRLDDMTAHPQSFGFPPHHPAMQSLLGVPIFIKGKAIGALYLTEKVGGFTQEDEALLTTLAADAAVAVEKTRLLEETRYRHQEAVSLEAVAREITGSLERGEVFQRIVDHARELCKADLAFLAPCDREAGTATIVAASGAKGQDLMALTIVRGRGSGGKVLETGEPFITENYLNDPRITKDYAEVAGQEDFVAQAVVPLRLRGAITGLLWVVNRAPRRFTPQDLMVLERLADQAAIALENSRLYEELRAALKEIVRTERLRALGEMAAGVAHDFNNILAAILGRAQLLLAQTEDPELQRQLQVIEKAATDGARSVRRIQEFTRMRLARPFQPVDLNQVVKEVVEVTRSRWKDDAQARGIRYDVLVEPTPVPPVAGDPSELREVLTNLVFNALDAMPEGGRVTLRTGVAGGRVYCVVTDTGIGMSEEVRQRVFDPFFTTKAERGTGLGLSVVYGIVTRHGGEIEVESQVGKGSAFTIWLPVGQEIPEPPETAPPPRPHRSAKILVIDDESEVRKVLVELLTGQGHAVAACADGPSALSRLQEELFDLVVTDLGMPGLSGWAVARLVKLQKPETVVVMVTGWGDRIDPEEARTNGVEFLVAKPFNLDEVMATISNALSLRDSRMGDGPRTQSRSFPPSA
jgi:GAF domain-containing protein/CheY-like chemotaxis protein